MCGIFGLVNVNISEKLAYRCLDTIAHRGPDGGRVWQEEGITLGHRRLSILDLSEKGSQPMSYADGRYELVFNGEIYNFLEIRDRLVKKGYSFYSDSDSEVLLAAYIEWGESCVNDFNGMWSFAIWDRKLKKLFLSRDRFGVKPLYYIYLNKDKSALAFASEMKALMPLMVDDETAENGEKIGINPNKSIVCDPNRIVYYESTRDCVLDKVYRFPAGCNGLIYMDPMVSAEDINRLKKECSGDILNTWVRDGEASDSDFSAKRQSNSDKIEAGGLYLSQYWNTLDHLMELPKSYEEQVELCRQIFLDACKIRMRSDVTIGTALSGGLDSSATICAMAHLSKECDDLRMNKDWQHAFVASFPGTTQDETAYAKKVTDFLGIKSCFVEIDPVSAIDKLLDYVYLQEDVYLTSPIPMMLLYGALRGSGTIVTIDGHGADELFGGYTFDFIEALNDAKSKEEKDTILTAYIESFPKDGSNMSMKAPTSFQVKKDIMIRKLADVKNASKQPYKKVKAAGDPRYKRMDTLGKRLYASSHETILPTLLRNYDRYAMANSVEIRMPFMDYRMVCLAMSLPWQSRLHGGFSKSIIRDAMAPYMPEEIAYRRTKIGFNTPIVEWMQGPLKGYFTDIISSSDFINSELIDSARVRADITEVINNPRASFAMGEKAFVELYPYLWEKGFLRRGLGCSNGV